MSSTSVFSGDLELDPPAGVRRWLISCDETGLHGARCCGFGSLWMAWQRRGDFQQWMRDIRASHPEYKNREFKWEHVNRHTLPTYLDLVDLFFRHSSLAFHCLIVEKALIDKERHGGDYDLARRKFFTHLVTCKIANALRARPERDQTFRIWVDPIASRYPKADEVVQIVANRMLQKRLAPTGWRGPVVDGVIEHDSKETFSIQLCDVLLGAVAATWQREPVTGPKLELQQFIASHINWKDLRSDTLPRERKFNIWIFDPTPQSRRLRSRDVVLRYPLPPMPSTPLMAARYPSAH